MSLHLFAGLRVRDFEAARSWYEQLLGEPTFFPRATETVWTIADSRSVYVVEHAVGAGNCVVMIFVDDLEAQLAAIAARGLELTSGRPTPTACARCCTATPTATRLGSATRRSVVA